MRIGVDLGGTKIEAIVLEDDGETARRRIPAPRGDYRRTIDAVANLVAEIAGGDTNCPVGIGIPGTESPATGLIKNANSTWLIGMPLKADLENALGRQIRLANDANCFALSEARDGAGASADIVFGVILGTGVGGGIAIHGNVLTGANAVAGEWGHNPLPAAADDERPGPKCYCGRTGCLETFLSGPAFARDAGAPTAEDAVTRAASGDANAKAALDRYADRLARALGTVINLLDPGIVVLGGGLSNIDALYADVPARWRRYIFSDRVDTKLVKAIHGDSSGVRGAAWLWPADGVP